MNLVNTSTKSMTAYCLSYTPMNNFKDYPGWSSHILTSLNKKGKLSNILTSRHVKKEALRNTFAVGGAQAACPMEHAYRQLGTSPNITMKTLTQLY